MESAERKRLRSASDVQKCNQAAEHFNVRGKALNQEQLAIQTDQDGYNDIVLQINARCGNMMVGQAVALEVDKDFPPKVKK